MCILVSTMKMVGLRSLNVTNYLRSCEVLFNGGEQNFVLGRKHRQPQNFRGWLEMITQNGKWWLDGMDDIIY